MDYALYYRGSASPLLKSLTMLVTLPSPILLSLAILVLVSPNNNCLRLLISSGITAVIYVILVLYILPTEL